jgi:pimeloyl-ACP methyl ester carboxylesterase
VIFVVTVHGLWTRGASMAILRRRLESHGLRVVSFSYPSVTQSLEANTAALEACVDAVPGDTVHLVSHSLGGLLICALLERRRPARLGRIVCLGAPFKGSRTAARLARWPGGKHLVGSCALDVNARRGFDKLPAGVEVGSIAGRIPLGVGRLLGRFPEPNDGTVAVAETKIDGLADHVVLPVSHAALLWSRAVSEQTEHFLLRGRFRRAGDLELRAPGGGEIGPSQP